MKIVSFDPSERQRGEIESFLDEAREKVLSGNPNTIIVVFDNDQADIVTLHWGNVPYTEKIGIMELSKTTFIDQCRKDE